MQKNTALLAVLIAVLAVIGLSFSQGGSGSSSFIVLAKNNDFQYETFSESRFDELKGKESFSVFVHSKNCGTCAKKNKEIIDDVNKFQSGTILKLEYDEAPQNFLEKYEVTKYDTFVNFDTKGNATTIKGAKVEEVRNAIQ